VCVEVAQFLEDISAGDRCNRNPKKYEVEYIIMEANRDRPDNHGLTATFPHLKEKSIRPDHLGIGQCCAVLCYLSSFNQSPPPYRCSLLFVPSALRNKFIYFRIVTPPRLERESESAPENAPESACKRARGWGERERESESDRARARTHALTHTRTHAHTHTHTRTHCLSLCCFLDLSRTRALSLSHVHTRAFSQSPSFSFLCLSHIDTATNTDSLSCVFHKKDTET